MLHILWMLFKIILIIVGILLGIVLLTLLLVLFCPVRYRASVTKTTNDFKEVVAGVTVSWLFYGIQLQLGFQNGGLTKRLRVLGVPILEILKKRKEKKRISPTKNKDSTAKKSRRNNKYKEKKERTESLDSVNLEVEVPENQEKNAEMLEPVEDVSAEESMTSQQKAEIEDPEENMDSKEKVSVSEKIENIILLIQEKLKKVSELYHKILSKLRNIHDTIDWWKEFLTHPKVKSAVTQIKNDLFRLLKHIFPTRLKGNVTFGSEDPSTTGTVLAILGMTMPFHKNKIEVTPVFDGSNILVGNVILKGRIYGVVLVKIALEILFNKNVKYIIYRWKHKED